MTMWERVIAELDLPLSKEETQTIAAQLDAVTRLAGRFARILPPEQWPAFVPFLATEQGPHDHR